MNFDATKPHQVIMTIKIDAYQENDVGECDLPIPAKDLAEFNLKSKQVIQVKGFDKTDCLKKVREKLNVFN